MVESRKEANSATTDDPDRKIRNQDRFFFNVRTVSETGYVATHCNKKMRLYEQHILDISKSKYSDIGRIKKQNNSSRSSPVFRKSIYERVDSEFVLKKVNRKIQRS